MRRDRGFALLIVLWTLSLLSLLITQIAGSGRQALRLAGNLRAQAALQAVADGAMQEAGFHVAAAGRAHWPADGTVHTLREDGAEIRLRITNEAGRVNPSIASLELMTAMVHGCGFERPAAAAVAGAIVAWRFPNAQTSYGADAYRRAGRGYAPPAQPFESLDELGLVLGVTPALLACLSPHLSLYRESDPDPNAADPLVLRALTEMLGTPPPLSDAPVEESLFRVSVSAAGADGARVVRQAVLRIDAEAGQHDAQPPFQVLDWSR